MSLLRQAISLLFSAYALGLVAYVVLSWAEHPKAKQARQWLEQFYSPFLVSLRKYIRPIPMGNVRLDLSPLVLLLAIHMVQQLIMLLI